MSDLPDWMNGSQSTGTAIEEPNANPTPAPSPDKDLPSWMQGDGTDKLKASIQAGQKIPPDQAAKVLQYKDQTGLPSSIVSRNLPSLEQQNPAISTDIQKQAPKVSEWMAEDPHHAALASQDVPILSFLERQFSYMGNQLERGAFDVERNALGVKAFFGKATPEDEKRIEAINRRLQTDLNKPAPGPISNVFGKAVESAPMMVGAIGAGLAGATLGAPSIIGAGLGFGGLELGSHYLEHRTIKDENLNPISNSEARGMSVISHVVNQALALNNLTALTAATPEGDTAARLGAMTSGTLNTALSFVPMGSIMEKVPGLKMLSSEGIGPLMKNPTARMALQNYVKGIGESSATMGGYSGLSTLIHSATGKLTDMFKDKSIYTASPMQILSTIFSPEALKEAGQATVSGATTGGIFGGTLGSYQLMHDYQGAIQNQEAWRTIGDAVKSAKMQEMAPAQLEKVVQRIAPDQNVFIPMDKWQSYWGSKKIDPRTAFEQTAGNTGSYDESLRTGADVQIPASKYATTIAPSEHNEAFLTSLRSDPAALNAEEVREGLKLKGEQDQAANAAKQPSLFQKGMDLVKGLFGRQEPAKTQEIPSQPEQVSQPVETKGVPAVGYQSKVFPLESLYEEHPLLRSIEGHPDFVKMTKDADLITQKYAQERGVEPTRELATDLFREMHDQLGRIMKAKPEERADVIKDIQSKYPDLQNEFRTLHDKLYSDLHEGFFQRAIEGKYGPTRPKIALEAEEAKQAIIKEGLPPKEITQAAFTKDPAQQTLKAAQIEEGDSLFDDPKSVGMKPDEETRYLKARLQAEESASKQMADKINAQQERLKNVDIKSLRNEIEPQVNSQKEYRALDTLKNTAGLSREAIEKDFPDFDPKKLPRGVIQEGGNHPDLAAEMLGYRSGSELLFNLETAPDREQVINDKIKERLEEKYGDPLTQKNLLEEAYKSIHTTDRSRLLQLELQHLASGDFAAFKGMLKTITRSVPKLEEIRNQAEDTIDSKKAGETIPSLYRKAESAAGREAKDFFFKGDFEKAFEAKSRQILNNELFRVAQNAREQMEKDLNFVSKFDSDSVRAKLGKAGSNYLDQIDNLREKFDFSPITNKDLSKRQSLRDFVDEQQRAGYSPDIPSEILNEANRKSWKEMTNQELNSVVDSMRMIDHLAGLKNKLLASSKERDYNDVKSDVINSLDKTFSLDPNNLKEPVDLHPSLIDKFKTVGSKYAAWQTKMEYLFRFMDGGEYHGPVWETYMKPLNDAENVKTQYLHQDQATLNDIFKDYSKSELGKMSRQLTHFPELGTSTIKPELTRLEQIMTVLHWGNEGNRAEIMRGYNWTEDQVRSVWRNLDKRDLETANRIWKWVDSYWPAISKQERELNGLTPEKIESSPFDVQLKDGSTVHMDGGYFPLIYDHKLSPFIANARELENLKDLIPTQAGRAATRHGWTNERVGGGGQAPSLSFSSVIGHMSDVVHDLAYRKPVIDLYKLINDADIQDHMKSAVGNELYNQLNPWLKRIAGDRPWNPLNPIEQLLTGIRANVTVAELGYKFTSAAVHSTSFFPATREIGAGYSINALKDFYTNIHGSWDFITDKSEFMRARSENMDRDLKSYLLAKNRLLDSPAIQSSKWFLMRAFDTGVAGPTWLGAYRKAMDGGVKNIEAGNESDAIDYADQLVRDTKGSSAAKDLSAMESGSPMSKIFTMFMRQQNVIMNQFMEAHREYGLNNNKGRLLSAYVMAGILPAAMSELIRGRTPQEDESWGKWLAKSTAFYVMGADPLARNIAAGWNRGTIQVSPAIEALSTMLSAAKSVTKEEWTQHDYENAFNALGYATGLPTRQAFRTAQYLHNYLTGEEQPENPLEFLGRALVGQKSKR